MEGFEPARGLGVSCLFIHLHVQVARLTHIAGAVHGRSTHS